MSLLVGSFEYNNHRFKQIIFTEQDDRVEILDEQNKLILIFTADTYILFERRKIGRLYQLDGAIYASFFTDGIDQVKHIPTGIQTYVRHAYFKAEELVTKYFLDNKEVILGNIIP